LRQQNNFHPGHEVAHAKGENFLYYQYSLRPHGLFSALANGVSARSAGSYVGMLNL
jgi:hypothetical protein